MRRVKGMVGVCCALVLALMLLVVGVFAASTATVNINVSVNYQPKIHATIKAATSDEANSSIYYSGSGDFPAGAVTLAEDATTRLPSATLSEYLNCDVFGRITVYLQVTNETGFAIMPQITLATGTAGVIDCVESVQSLGNASAISKVTIKSTSATSGDIQLNVNLVRCDGVDGSIDFDALSYKVKDSVSGNVLIEKTATKLIVNGMNGVTVGYDASRIDSYTFSYGTDVSLSAVSLVNGATAIKYSTTAGTAPATSVSASATANLGTSPTVLIINKA